MASLTERINSHAAAGCRTSGHFSRTAVACSNRRLREPSRISSTCTFVSTVSLDGSKWSARAFSSQSSTGKENGFGKCQALQAVDYSFYQVVEAVDITPDYLWVERLAPVVTYLSVEHQQKLYEALKVAFKSHEGQKRKSGEPFITHPVEVTRILGELKMDYESLIAGLLHDTVEDTDNISFDEIGVWFGPAVRRIVEGETKFSKLGKLTTSAAGSVDLKALDLQQLFLAMTEEVRIIVVKLADRLHNMRTLGSMTQQKQRKIAEETLQVFAPLARLLGLYSIKEELEDLGFRYVDPRRYNQIKARLETQCEQQQAVLEEAKEVLEDHLRGDQYLRTMGASCSVEIHYKAVYSVFKRSTNKKADIKDLSDIAQLRVIVHQDENLFKGLYGSSSQLCYHVMGVVHTMWAPVPGSVKDYIATPKTNGYQSLHTVVLPLGSQKLFPLQVQIRTLEMQRLAEYGIAGENWVAAAKVMDFIRNSQAQQLDGSLALGGTNGVKVNGTAVNGTPVNRTAINGAKVNGTALNGKQAIINGTELPVNGKAILKQAVQYNREKLDQSVLIRRVNWLNSIREWQEEFLGSLTAREFVDCVTDDLLGQGVFVFTPSGEAKRLPKGATVVDFAYHVHTDIGNLMVTAKINNQPVHPSHVLQNAEVVEIVTYDGPVTANTVLRHQSWLSFAKTRSARIKLARFLNKHAPLLTQHASTACAALGAPVMQTTFLRVLCTDRAGLLADISQIIARHGHNIKAYSGQRETDSGDFIMDYELEGDIMCLECMCEKIAATVGVNSWSVHSEVSY